MTATPDSFAAVVAELRELSSPSGYVAELNVIDLCDRIERLDAEMRKERELLGVWQTEVTGYLIVAGKLRPDFYESPRSTVHDLIEVKTEELRARLAACEKALSHYVEDTWAPVADYSDNYWYQSGKAPWKHAEKALASRPSPGAMGGEGEK